MKNILLNLIILSSSLIYSADIKINNNKIQELKSSPNKEKRSAYLYEKDINFGMQKQILSDKSNQQASVNGWKIFKGIAGLILGIKCFILGGNCILISLILPQDCIYKIIQSTEISSPMKKILTHRVAWLSLSSLFTAFSGWIIAKSATSLHDGFNVAEETTEVIDKKHSNQIMYKNKRPANDLPLIFVHNLIAYFTLAD